MGFSRLNILPNQFYAALDKFSAPKRGREGAGCPPKFSVGGLPLAPCSAAYVYFRLLFFGQSGLVSVGFIEDLGTWVKFCLFAFRK